MNPMPADDGQARMRASDADRDRVLAELSEHFQAGRLTTDELQERTGEALSARTMGELSQIMDDLPDLHPAPAAPPAPAPELRPASPARHFPAAAGVVIALALLAVVLVSARTGHFGGAGAIIPVVIIARLLVGGRGPAGRRR